MRCATMSRQLYFNRQLLLEVSPDMLMRVRRSQVFKKNTRTRTYTHAHTLTNARTHAHTHTHAHNQPQPPLSPHHKNTNTNTAHYHRTPPPHTTTAHQHHTYCMTQDMFLHMTRTRRMHDIVPESRWGLGLGSGLGSGLAGEAHACYSARVKV